MQQVSFTPMARNPQIRVPEKLHPYVRMLIALHEKQQAKQALQQIVAAESIEEAIVGWEDRAA
jgi:hypothetical protein